LLDQVRQQPRCEANEERDAEQHPESGSDAIAVPRIGESNVAPRADATSSAQDRSREE
jgi:hypothetical protein